MRSPCGSLSTLVAALATTSLPIVSVDAHGFMITPLSRNTIDKDTPFFEFGQFPLQTNPPTPGCAPTTGSCGCWCTNGTSRCEVAQSCFFFSQGCSIGCEECDGVSARTQVGMRVCGRGGSTQRLRRRVCCWWVGDSSLRPPCFCLLCMLHCRRISAGLAHRRSCATRAFAHTTKARSAIRPTTSTGTTRGAPLALLPCSMPAGEQAVATRASLALERRTILTPLCVVVCVVLLRGERRCVGCFMGRHGGEIPDKPQYYGACCRCTCVRRAIRCCAVWRCGGVGHTLFIHCSAHSLIIHSFLSM